MGVRSMSHSTATIVESQPDWLTGAAVSRERSDALRDQAARWAMQEESLGNRITPFATHGYQGHRCGRVAVGQGEGDRTILQLSGALADEHLTEVLPLLDRVTRIDLAVTVRTAEPDLTVAENAYQMAAWYWDEHPRSAVPWRIQHRTQGETCYVGSRQSDYFCRIYDKHAECRHNHDQRGAERYHNCWRYEIECKGHTAPSVAVSVDSAVERASFVQDNVSGYLRRHGVEPIFTESDQRLLLPGFTRRSDAESRLWHLARNVRPSLDWLRDTGHTADALAALGIGETPIH